MNRERKHLEKLAEKRRALHGKLALLEMHEKLNDPDDYDYVLELRRKVRNLTVQLQSMKPEPTSWEDS